MFLIKIYNLLFENSETHDEYMYHYSINNV